jgi:hypothetical protein
MWRDQLRAGQGEVHGLWVGPPALLPFNPCRFHKNWRWSYAFGGGQRMDWVCHHGDIAH